MVGRRGLLLAAPALLLSACGRERPTSGGSASKVDRGTEVQGDIEVLTAALVSEGEAAAAYAIAGDRLAGPAREAAIAIAANERAHAKRLSDAIADLGGEVPDRGLTVALPDDDREALGNLRTLTADAIALYVDSLPKLSDSDLRVVVASIAAAEAEHLAVLDGLLDDPQVADSFVYGERDA